MRAMRIASHKLLAVTHPVFPGPGVPSQCSSGVATKPTRDTRIRTSPAEFGLGFGRGLARASPRFQGATDHLCVHISGAGLPTLSAPVEPRASEAARGWKRYSCSCRRLQLIPPCREMLRLSDPASQIEPAGQTCCLVFVPTANGRKRHVPRQHRVILLPEHCLAW